MGTAGIEGGKVVVAGLSNTYTHYITTWEEYQRQRYEAASTIYGPHTLLAYIQQFDRITKAMIMGESVEAGTPPPDLSGQEISFVPGVLLHSPGTSLWRLPCRTANGCLPRRHCVCHFCLRSFEEQLDAGGNLPHSGEDGRAGLEGGGQG